jgi:membrane protein implicated in regulation of membrane protease activity
MLEILMTKPWTLWAFFALFCLILEMVLPYFACLFIAISGALSALAAGLGWNHWFQLLVFAACLVVGLIFVRPKIIHATRHSPGVSHRADDLIGKSALVTVSANRPGDMGRVTISNEDWAAKSEVAITAGDTVQVTGSDGIILIVQKT